MNPPEGQGPRSNVTNDQPAQLLHLHPRPVLRRQEYTNGRPRREPPVIRTEDGAVAFDPIYVLSLALVDLVGIQKAHRKPVQYQFHLKTATSCFFIGARYSELRAFRKQFKKNLRHLSPTRANAKFLEEGFDIITFPGKNFHKRPNDRQMLTRRGNDLMLMLRFALGTYTIFLDMTDRLLSVERDLFVDFMQNFFQHNTISSDPFEGSGNPQDLQAECLVCARNFHFQMNIN